MATGKAETLTIKIDKANRKLEAVVTQGTTQTLNFRANEDCEVRFDNPAVFGTAILSLTKGKMAPLPVKDPTQTTGFEVWISQPLVGNIAVQPTSAVPKSRPWPILP